MTTPSVRGERRTVRAIYKWLVWILLVAIVAQVYLAGYGIFGGGFGAHIGLGWPLAHMIVPIVAILGFFCRLGRNLVLTNVALLVLAAALPILPGAGSSYVAALHPLLAVFVFGITLYLAYRTRTFAFRPKAVAAQPATARSPA